MQAPPPLSRCLRPQPDPCADKPQFMRVDLHEKLESFFLEMVMCACKVYDTDYDLACAIKQCLDKKFGPEWHVIVGEKFGSHIEHQPKAFAHILYQGRSFLICRHIKQFIDDHRAHMNIQRTQVKPPDSICIQYCDKGPCEDKPKLIRSDINEKLEAFFLEMVVSACKIYEDDYDLACAIKRCLDKKFGPQWHVIVGEMFGSHFEHQPKSFVYINHKGKFFLMFRFG
ncbi:unnamed protein product [Dibothriocephalus latus]|uniref:Dynein light chain n=1 Tax=Dibothriocephalus latus TaxID=60516 RepID=A0A3P6SL38_DIBLA|nr:unnamed protein product [Dibothriocephalus latus]